MDPDLPLPPYLEPLPTTDPQYDSLNASAYEYAYGPEPGDGNLKAFQIVRFMDNHTAYRVWGGPADECGYWWDLAPPENCMQVCPEYDDAYFREVFAVCPEWNTMSNVTTVNIPVGTAAVVGVGQSANCTDGLVINPSDAILQLNGDACSFSDGYVSCATDENDLQASACIQTCPGAILPTLDEDGVLRCEVGVAVSGNTLQGGSGATVVDAFSGLLAPILAVAWLF